MSNEDLRQDCLAHWRRILDLSVEDIREGKEPPSSDRCAFCQAYYEWPECSECPIAKSTGEGLCHGTPYEDAANKYFNIKAGENRRLAEFRKAVKKEIRFLERLEVN